jgi:hypothetical protein
MYKRFVKPVIIGVIGLSVVVTLISLLLPSEVHGRRGIVINAAKEKILPQINDFFNWKQWQPNFQADSAGIIYGKLSFGEDGRCEINRKNGKTDQYRFKLNNDSSIIAIQHRDGERDVENIFTLSKDQSSSGTYVDWKFITHLKWYPWEKFSGFFTESFTAPGMEQGLENLKKIAEGH